MAITLSELKEGLRKCNYLNPTHEEVSSVGSNTQTREHLSNSVHGFDPCYNPSLNANGPAKAVDFKEPTKATFEGGRGTKNSGSIQFHPLFPCESDLHQLGKIIKIFETLIHLADANQYVQIQPSHSPSIHIQPSHSPSIHVSMATLSKTYLTAESIPVCCCLDRSHGTRQSGKINCSIMS